jgi:histidyl-tRNA synthetase
VIHEALASAGVPAFTISLNNRKVLDGLLDTLGVADRTGPVLRALDKLGKIGRDKVRQELVAPAVEFKGSPDESGTRTSTLQGVLTEEQAERVLTFVEQGRGGAEVLSRAEGQLGSHPRAKEGIDNLRSVLDLLDAGGVPAARFKIDLGLARGLDYYTGIVYETTVDGWEKFGSVSSGGRYDNLASLFTDRRLPGVGASIGLDRLLALLEEAGWMKGSSAPAPVLVANFPGTDATVPFRLAATLRAAGVGAEVFPDPLQVGKQMGYGSTRGHRFAVIVGPDEVGKQVFNLRDLTTRQEQKSIPWTLLVDSVKSALAEHEALSP